MLKISHLISLETSLSPTSHIYKTPVQSEISTPKLLEKHTKVIGEACTLCAISIRLHLNTFELLLIAISKIMASLRFLTFFSPLLLIITLSLVDSTSRTEASRILETALPKVPELPKTVLPELPPLPKVPELPKPELPEQPSLPKVPALPKPELPEQPSLPKVPELPKPELPEQPSFPKVELPPLPKPEFPVLPKPELPVLPKPEFPVLPKPELPVLPKPEVPKFP
ncbi:hypothetical protein SADUNF_Sadunf07G0098500 [Salix dunnii]|uniref:Uncharacterized protein n=1 Tax=Salix dunnii TaxID=1413687 RepID=A0A835K0C1_9ROSI|nr:hypothetical protein SADUNF_Sadunf07G0098500 [Salix dunnii]